MKWSLCANIGNALRASCILKPENRTRFDFIVRLLLLQIHAAPDIKENSLLCQLVRLVSSSPPCSSLLLPPPASVLQHGNGSEWQVERGQRTRPRTRLHKEADSCVRGLDGSRQTLQPPSQTFCPGSHNEAEVHITAAPSTRAPTSEFLSSRMITTRRSLDRDRLGSGYNLSLIRVSVIFIVLCWWISIRSVSVGGGLSSTRVKSAADLPSHTTLWIFVPAEKIKWNSPPAESSGAVHWSLRWGMFECCVFCSLFEVQV